MITLLERLRANHCQFSEFVQTMLLLSTLPQKWDHLASVYIQETKVENFSLVSLREQITEESAVTRSLGLKSPMVIPTRI